MIDLCPKFVPHFFHRKELEGCRKELGRNFLFFAVNRSRLKRKKKEKEKEKDKARSTQFAGVVPVDKSDLLGKGEWF